MYVCKIKKMIELMNENGKKERKKETMKEMKKKRIGGAKINQSINVFVCMYL